MFCFLTLSLSSFLWSFLWGTWAGGGRQGAEVRGKIECDAARINGKFDGVFVSAHSLQVKGARQRDASGDRFTIRLQKIGMCIKRLFWWGSENINISSQHLHSDWLHGG